MDIVTFTDAFVSWGKTQSDIVAIALVGSYARDAARAESDVDVMVLTVDLAKHFGSQEWLSLFGKVEESKVENWGRVETIRAFYQNSFEIEYNFTEPDWADIPVDSGTYRVVSDGMKILHDPKSVLKALQKEVLLESRVKN